MIWIYWIVIMVSMFLGISIYYLFTPVQYSLSNSFSNSVNFSNAINTSFQQTVTYNNKMWDLWPLVLVGLCLVVLFIVSQNDDDGYRYSNEDYRYGGK